jgi:hypothetical protein
MSVALTYLLAAAIGHFNILRFHGNSDVEKEFAPSVRTRSLHDQAKPEKSL